MTARKRKAKAPAETRIDLSLAQAQRLSSLAAEQDRAQGAVNLYLRSILDGQGINGNASNVKLDGQTLMVTTQEA